MPLSALTQSQKVLLDGALQIYFRQSQSPTPLLDILLLTNAQLKAAVSPIVTMLQTAAQTAQTNLAANQAAQTTAVNQTVTDWAAVVTNLG